MEIRKASSSDAEGIANLINCLAIKFVTPQFSVEATQHFLSANN